MSSTFSCVFWPSVHLWRNVYLGLFPFIKWVACLILLLIHINCLYILEIRPLPVTSFANIFSLSVGYIFIFFIVSFTLQKDINLISSYLFILLFSLELGYRSKILLQFMSVSVLPILLSMIFIVSDLTFQY